MISLPVFLRSPLARHPGLFVRKVADRLRLRSAAPPPAPASLSHARPRAGWLPVLRALAPPGSTPVPPAPFHHVFEQSFDEALLFELCQQGPRRGQKDLTGDIKLIWDFSRAHALWPNAAHGHVDPCVTFLQRWTEAAPGPDSPAWSCAMDVALRAVNWILADALVAGEISRRFGPNRWAELLWQHGAVIWHRLETNLICSNHYLADLLGLVAVGSLFPDDPAARQWLAFARNEFPRALLAQTRPDGGLGEASARYHAFVTEMALVTRLLLSAPFPEAAEARLEGMVQAVADLRDAGGDLFPLGDDDSGLVLALSGTLGKPRGDALITLASTLLGRSWAPRADALYPDSGWWVCRRGEFVLALEFGGVGLSGLGGHAHNDDLSVVLEWRGRPVIVDPGTYLYTCDPAARDEFRSVRAHNTVILDDLEPRPLGPGPFRLPGPDCALPHRIAGSSSGIFTRDVRTMSGVARHERSVTVHEHELILADAVSAPGAASRLEWRFQLHPQVHAVLNGSRVRLSVPEAGVLELAAPDGVGLELQPARFSHGYGQVQATRVLVGKSPAVGTTPRVWKFRAASEPR